MEKCAMFCELKCAVRNCKNVKFKGVANNSYDIRFHKYPKNIEKCRIWLHACGRNDLLQKSFCYVFANYYVCSDHFKPSQYKQGNILLMNDAVPMINRPSDQLQIGVEVLISEIDDSRGKSLVT